MRNPRLVCRYAMIIASVCVLSFAVSDLTRGSLGVCLDVPVASTVYAKGGHGHGHHNGFWSNLWKDFWSDVLSYLQSRPVSGYQYQGSHHHKVPEPSTTVLLGLGLAGVYAYRRRKQR